MSADTAAGGAGTPATPVEAYNAVIAGSMTGTGAVPLMDLLQQPTTVPPETTAAGREPADFLEFYGLRTNPFPDSVNPAFFYKTDVHDVAYIRMMMAIDYGISLALVTGTSGTGKTLLSQMLLRNLDPARYIAILVLVTPGMSKTALLREILSELNIAAPEHNITTHDLLKLLSGFIINLYSQGQRLVVIIDECHFLSAECLHLLRTISNIEIPDQKLSTCVLFGEQKFLKRLEHPSFESLKNRMYLRSELAPLDLRETAQYVKFRLMVAGRDEPLFDEGALDVLHRLSRGVCRGINKIGMLSLLDGFMHKRDIIDADVVNASRASL